MEVEQEGAYPVDLGQSRSVSPLTESQAIRIAARVGVWGTLAGFGSFLALGAGLGVPVAVAVGLVSAGLIGGGAGLAATGALVVRAKDRVARKVLAGALATIPLGLSILLLGLDVASNGAIPRNLLTAATTIMLVAGAVLGVLLGSGVWSALRSAEESEDAPAVPE